MEKNWWLCLVMLFYCQALFPQTPVEFPTAKNVLLVCKRKTETPVADDTSYQVLQYYAAQRNIPDVNIYKEGISNVGLDLPDFMPDENSPLDTVKVIQHGEMIEPYPIWWTEN